MKPQRLVFALSLLLPSWLAAATASPPDDPLTALQKSIGLSIRQGVADQNTLQKPAAFQWVRAAGQTDSSSIDVGVTLRAYDNQTWFVGPTAEYHRQTLTAKKQENFQAGLSVIYTAGDPTTGWAAYCQAALSYKDDRYATGEAAAGKITCTPYNATLDRGLGSAVGPGGFKFLWQPSFGWQYEAAQNIRKTGLKGHTHRAYFNLEVGLYPFAHYTKRRFEIIVRETIWHHIAPSPVFKRLFDREQKLFSASANYYLDAARHVSVGLDHIDGQNPEQGLAKQRSTTVALKLRL